MSTKNIYMDYTAGRPIDHRVWEAMSPYVQSFYVNPSSVHSFGQKTKQAAIFFGLAMEMTASMAGGVVVGYFLDKAFDTFPWLTGIFFIGGIGAAINIAIFMVKKYRKVLE